MSYWASLVQISFSDLDCISRLQQCQTALTWKLLALFWLVSAQELLVLAVCRYKIELTEMQVLMGRLHDNWRHAYARGTSQMHIVDRFSISLQLERLVLCCSWSVAGSCLGLLWREGNSSVVLCVDTCVCVCVCVWVWERERERESYYAELLFNLFPFYSNWVYVCVCFHVYICVCVRMVWCISVIAAYHMLVVCVMCRRLIVTADPQWPTATMSGTLPSLTFHLNERKVSWLHSAWAGFTHHLYSTSVRERWGTMYISRQWEKGEALCIFHVSERKVRHYLYSTSVRERWGTMYISPQWEKGEALSIFHLSERKVRHYVYCTSVRERWGTMYIARQRKVRHYLYFTSVRERWGTVYFTSVRERWGTMYISRQWEKGEALSIFHVSERRVRHYLYFTSVREGWGTICISPQWEKGELLMCWQMPVYWCWCVDRCLRIDDNDVLTDVYVLMCQQIQALWTCADTLSSSSSSTLASSHNLSASGASLSSMPSMTDSMHASVWVTHFALTCVGQHLILYPHPHPPHMTACTPQCESLISLCLMLDSIRYCAPPPPPTHTHTHIWQHAHLNVSQPFPAVSSDTVPPPPPPHTHTRTHTHARQDAHISVSHSLPMVSSWTASDTVPLPPPTHTHTHTWQHAHLNVSHPFPDVSSDTVPRAPPPLPPPHVHTCQTACTPQCESFTSHGLKLDSIRYCSPPPPPPSFPLQTSCRIQCKVPLCQVGQHPILCPPPCFPLPSNPRQYGDLGMSLSFLPVAHQQHPFCTVGRTWSPLFFFDRPLVEPELAEESVADNNLFLVQFLINSLSLELQSQGEWGCTLVHSAWYSAGTVP